MEVAVSYGQAQHSVCDKLFNVAVSISLYPT